MPVDCILNIDKPRGITSHDAVDVVRRITGTKKVGHSGTLDPFASGVLVVGVNQGSKLLPFLQQGTKEYEAVILLGVETDTLDCDGKVIREAACPEIGTDELNELLASFRGKQEQCPPAFSAIKRDGVPLYKLARKGIDVEPPVREIEIHNLEVIKVELPLISIRVTCSGGTYIRSLARDIGARIGCGGHLTSLRRTRNGEFGIGNSVTLDRLKEMGKEWHEAAVRLADAVPYRRIVVDVGTAERIRMGMVPASSNLGLGGGDGGRFAILSDAGLVAVIEISEGMKTQFLRVFNP